METREQAEHDAVQWIARRESGPWDERDEAAFDAWLGQSMTRRVAYYRYKRTWQEAGRLGALGNGPLPEHPLSGVFEASPASSAPTKSSWRVGYAIAASVAVAVVAVTLLNFRAQVLGRDTYRTPIGGLTAVPMADGSRVTLNTDSRLSVVVSERERRIELERGEAYFEVAKDPRRPFVVAVGGKQIVAVGTQFSVRREGEDVRVSVTEGAVRLISDPGNAVSTEGVLLAAGAVGHAQPTGITVERKALADLEQQLTWRAGILTFRDTPLVEAVAEFNRYNARQMFIEDPTLARIQVGGIFRSTDLDPFIRLIKDGLPVRIAEQGDRIVLSAR